MNFRLGPTFEDDKVFWTNCNMIATYNPDGGSYKNFQIKAELSTGYLIHTRSLSFSRLIPFTEVHTTLEETVPRLQNVCDRIYKEFTFMLKLLKPLNSKPPALTTRCIYLKQVTLSVLSGLRRIYRVYQEQYGSCNPPNPGLVDLKNLLDKYTPVIKKFDVPIFLSSRFPLFDFIQYNQNLDIISRYDPKATKDYTNHQIKSKAGSNSLVYTSTYDPYKAANSLTTLDKTVLVLKAVCDRAKVECSQIVSALKFQQDDDVIEHFRREVYSIVDHVIPGIIRINDTYSEHYTTHPGLKELKELAESLTWGESLLE